MLANNLAAECTISGPTATVEGALLQGMHWEDACKHRRYIQAICSEVPCAGLCAAVDSISQRNSAQQLTFDASQKLTVSWQATWSVMLYVCDCCMPTKT